MATSFMMMMVMAMTEWQPTRRWLPVTPHHHDEHAEHGHGGHIGAQVVSGDLFDGKSDVSKVRLVSLKEGSAVVAFPPVEDMIADRMGQFCAPNQRDWEMLGQAQRLYEIATYSLEPKLDEAYLERRIREETLGAYGLDFLKRK
jgi:hypothetical protein